MEWPGVQLQGVLDELYFYEGPLGACLTPEQVSITVWAPTAQQVASVQVRAYSRTCIGLLTKQSAKHLKHGLQCRWSCSCGMALERATLK